MIFETGNFLFKGFHSIDVMRSMADLANSFTIVSPNVWLSKGYELKAGNECSIYSDDGVEILRGYIDKVSPVIGGMVTITGRDKSADLIDSTVDGTGQFLNLTLGAIISQICKPFWITATGETGTLIKSFGYNKDDRAAHVIKKLVTRQGFLCTSNGVGGIVIGSPDEPTKAGFVLIEGTNILKDSFAVLDASKLHSEYTALGQSWGDNTPNSTFEGLANRHRPLTFINAGRNDTRDCDTSAEWMARVTDGLSQYYDISVAEVQDVAPNQLIDTNAVSLGLIDQQLLIRAVHLSAGREKKTTTRLIMSAPYIFGGSEVENTFL